MSQLQHSNKHYCPRLMLHSGQKAKTEIHYNYPIPQHTHKPTQRSDCDMMQSIPLWMNSVFVHMKSLWKLEVVGGVELGVREILGKRTHIKPLPVTESHAKLQPLKERTTITDKQEPFCREASSERCITKQLLYSLSFFSYVHSFFVDPPDNQSLARDLFGYVLVCFLISLLGFCCFGVWVARACPRSARQLLHYALLSSGIVCRLLSPWTLISIVSGLRDSFPFSSFSGSFLEKEKKSTVHATG